MIPFQYDNAIIERFPLLAGGAILATGLHNAPSGEGLRGQYAIAQQEVRAEIGTTPLSALETLAGWRAAFRGFGVDPTQYRSAVEALLRRLTKKGDIPSINTIVDACNLVSIRSGLPVAAIDLRAVRGVITVRFASGEEQFTPLGVAEPEHPEPGEVIFIDEAGLVLARRWCWRQSEESAAREETTDVLITVEAQHAGGRETVERAMANLQEILQEYAGGHYESAMIAG